MDWERLSLEEWQRYQPLSVLQLDVADRAVLRIAGTHKTWNKEKENFRNV